MDESCFFEMDDGAEQALREPMVVEAANSAPVACPRSGLVIPMVRCAQHIAAGIRTKRWLIPQPIAPPMAA